MNVDEIREDSLDIESLLKSHLKRKWNEFNSEEVKLSEIDREKAYSSIEYAMKIRRMRSLLKQKDLTSMTLSQCIYFLRKQVRIPLDVLSKIIKIDNKILDDIESGQINLYSISENTVANLLSHFQIKLNDFVQMFKNELLLDSSKRGISTTFARLDSTLVRNDRSKHIQQGLDALFLEVEKEKEEKRELKVNEDYINNVKSILHKMGEDNLLVE